MIMALEQILLLAYLLTYYLHFYVKFGDPSCIVFRYCAEKANTQTNRG